MLIVNMVYYISPLAHRIFFHSKVNDLMINQCFDSLIFILASFLANWYVLFSNALDSLFQNSIVSIGTRP